MAIIKSTFEIIRYFILLIILLCVSACGVCNKRAAESEFHNWSEEIHLDYKYCMCNGDDSDDNDYVSCTYTDLNNTPHSVECAKAFTIWLSGCREPKFQIK